MTIKLVVMDESLRTLYYSYEKHFSRPLHALLSALQTLHKQKEIDGELTSAAVTGSARELVGRILGIPYVSEIVAQAIAVSRLCPGARTIVEIGGQDSKFVQLGKPTSTGEPVIINQRMNAICAAGTGAFLEQQAEKLGIPIEDFGDIALQSTHPAFVAGRCAVFAKTDIIHLRQQGIPVPDIAMGICYAVARNYASQFVKGGKLDPPVVFQGGVAANKGVVKALHKVLKLNEGDLHVPELFKVMVAAGTAIMAMTGDSIKVSVTQLIERLRNYLEKEQSDSGRPLTLSPLERKIVRIETFKLRNPRPGEDVFVGIDVGSTSSCVAVIANDGSLLARSYTLNRGDLLSSVTRALNETADSLGKYVDTVVVRSAGVTGSGRYLVAKYVGADVVRDEISAQGRAAIYIMPDVDTVFEIGGQDSKYIRISNGRIVDFEMNKVCAAGTGAFLDEQAIRLQTEVSNLSNLAFASRSPANLGSRCTVFMESDIVNYQQMGIPAEDLAGGLSFSVARNYLEKVVGSKRIGEKILFLGGVAFNESVVSAFQRILNREIIVPEHHDVSGAIGIALIARDEYNKGHKQESSFRGFKVRERRYELSSFQCSDCQNNCRINRVVTDDIVFYHGGVCGRYEQKKKARRFANVFKQRMDLMLSYHDKAKNKKQTTEKIGIPRVHLFYEYFPVWCTFLQELGFEVVVSDATDKNIVDMALERTPIDNCFPCKLIYGHVSNLVKKGVKRVFLPIIVEFARKLSGCEHNFACPYVQSAPALLSMEFPEIEMISPVFVRYRRDDEWIQELEKVGHKLCNDASRVHSAVISAVNVHKRFMLECESLGRQFLESVPEDEKIFVVLGKFYNVYDSALNLNLVEKLLDMGVAVLPFDCLPSSREALPWNYHDVTFSSGQDLIRAARTILNEARYYPVMVTSFQCTPDSFMLKYLEELFSNKSYLVIEVDEHTSDVGILTRLEAFLNNMTDGAVHDFEKLSSKFLPFIAGKHHKKERRVMYVSSSYRSYRAIAAALESIGKEAVMLPVHDSETLRLGRLYSSGKECNPFIMETGSAVRMTQLPDFNPERSAICIPSSDIGCRIAFVSTAIQMVLARLGYPQVKVISPRVSMETDESLITFGPKFIRNTYRGMYAIELLIRLLMETRPYEKSPGASDRAFQDGVDDICRGIASGNFWRGLENAIKRFDVIERKNDNERLIIGIFGDDYTRDNAFANNNLEREIESLGGEVQHVSIWSGYLRFHSSMKWRNSIKKGRYHELIYDLPKWVISEVDALRIEKYFEGRLRFLPEPDFNTMMEYARRYVDPRTDPVVIIALARIVNLLRHGVDGIVNVVGFQCTVYNIVSAMLKKLCADFGQRPYLTMLYDFHGGIHHRNRLEAFMYQVRQYKSQNVHNQITKTRP